MNLVANVSKSVMSGAAVFLVDVAFSKFTGASPENPIRSLIQDPVMGHAALNGAIQTGTRAFVSEAVAPMISGNAIGRALNSARITDHVVSAGTAWATYSLMGSSNGFVEGMGMFIESALGDSAVDMFDSFASNM